MRGSRRLWLDVALGAIVIVIFGTSCSGGCGGCGALEPTPGGFPPEKRNANAAQLRVTQSGFDAIEADPAGLVGSLLPGGLSIPVPASCSGDPQICCTNGQPVPNCGPINIDLGRQAGDDDRLVLAPVQGQSQLRVTMRARLKTGSDLPVRAFGVNCGVNLDTTRGNNRDIELILPLSFQQDATAGTTRLVVGDITINRLENNDIQLNGGIACFFGNFGIGFFIDTLKNTFSEQIKGAIGDQLCKPCDSGDVGECGAFATACTDNVCMKGNDCLQELGLAGRARGSSVFGSLSPGTTGAIDLYEVLGGYATSNQNGLAFGMLGGMQPGGAARDRCGPPATDPGNVTIPVSAFFQGNTRPDTGQAFDVGIGLHASQLSQFAYAGYDGGFLCLTITGSTITQLSTDTFSLLSRSLGRLVAENSPMAVGLRPQSPPEITLGRNLFTDDGNGNFTLTEPLLDLRFQQMEIDFFASIDDQYVRVFTVVTDVRFPIGLQTTGMGELQPVIGDTDNAFTNIMVKNSEALTEAPADLAALFPSILNLALPQLSSGLSPISLPALGNLQLAVADVTAVDNSQFLAIFANLVPAQMPRPVDTRVALGDIYEPPTDVVAAPARWRSARAPEIQLSLGGDRGGDLEWSYRLDRGSWTPWSTNPRPTVRSNVLWLPGTHVIEVRARERGKPWTIDLTPASVDVELGAGVIRSSPVHGFHGQPGEAGCNCSTGGPMAALPFALVMLGLVVPLRRRIRRIRTTLRRARRLGAVTWLAAVACLPGCSCGSNPCGDVECLPGDLAHGGLGRWTSIAADDQRVIVATYDQGLGDLVVADVTDPQAIRLVAVDGIPEGITPTYDPSSYRGGVEGPGPDVGAWTSIAIADGLAMAAYQDRDAGALRFAFERERGQWQSYVVDGGDGEEVGRYTSIAITANGNPAIAYIALGVPDAGQRVTELRLARASTARPSRSTDWTTTVIDRAPGTCGGLCGGGEACIAGAGGQVCAQVTSDCASSCGNGAACVAGICTDAFGAPTVSDLATGTGLFARLVVLPDGRLAIVHYNRSARTLAIAVEDAPNTGAFSITTLDGGAVGDRGLWASAVVDGAGAIHVAYQDAIGDQLMYTTWNGTPGTPEVVDDGQRTGDRTHPVGAASAIFLVGGSPEIAYQDGMTSDVYLATRSGSAWSTSPIVAGPLLDGFSIAATTGHGAPYLAWDRLDPALPVPNTLFVHAR
jgi:MYXO-CTERM domain-containing protein